jgi:hypothetical protein
LSTAIVHRNDLSNGIYLSRWGQLLDIDKAWARQSAGEFISVWSQ